MIGEYQGEINQAVHALGRREGVIVVPTDTTYGVVCRLDYPLAIERIYTLKGRDRSKPLIVLGSDPGLLLQSVTGDLRAALALASRFWPGALTIVARAAETVPAGILAGGTTVGLRMPNHRAVLAILSRLPRCSAASTSANLSGAGAASSQEQVIASIGDLVDMVVPDCGQSPAGSESTIVDVSGSEPKILRAGALESELVFSTISEAVRR